MVLDYENKIKFYILHDYKKKTGPVPLSLIDSVIFFLYICFEQLFDVKGQLRRGLYNKHTCIHEGKNRMIERTRTHMNI